MTFTSLFIGLLTLILVLNCLLLILFVLVQLPKKEAGLGMAFGGAAADALFGAGSGTVISRWTKYGTISFLTLSLVLAVMRNHEARAVGRGVAAELERQSQSATPATAPAASPAPAPLSLTNPLPVPAQPAATGATTQATPAPAAEPPVPAPAPTP